MAIFDSNERSPLWGMAAAGALGTGIGIAAYRGRGAISEAIRSTGGEINESVISAVARAPGYNVGQTFSSTVAEGVQDSVLGIEKRLGFTNARQDIFQSAYESLISTGRFTPEAALGKVAGIKDAGTTLGAYGTAAEIISAEGGSADLFTRRIKDLANIEGRISPMAVSGGGLGQLPAGNIDPFSVSSEFQASAGKIRQRIERAAGTRFTPQFGNRFAGTVDNPLLSVSLGGKEMFVPINPNANTMTIGGTNYALRKAYTEGGEVIGYSEFSQRVIEDMLSKSGNATQLRQEIHAANLALIQNMRERDAIHMTAAIWSAPEQALTSGGLAANRLRELEAVAYGVESPEKAIWYDSVKKRGLTPFTSPDAAAKGTMYTGHLGEELFGAQGLLIGPEQRPGQFIRAEWGSTMAAKQAALTKGFGGEFGKYYSRLERKGATEGYRRLVYGGASAAAEEAYSVPQLMTFYAKPAGADKAGLGFADARLNRLLGAEEGVIAAGAGNMMGHERSVAVRIALNEGLDINADILGALQGKRQGEFVGLNIASPSKSGIGIGTELSTGRRIEAIANEGVFQRVVGAQLAGENEAIVHLKETRKLTPGELFKTFSEEQKALVGIRSEEDFMTILRQATGGQEKVGGQAIEQVMAGKLVQRNKMALVTQQMEAMSVFAAAKLSPGLDPMQDAMIRSFLEDPSAASRVKQLVMANDRNAHIAIQRNLMGLAKGFGFTGEELGMTFGLADVAAMEGTALSVTEREAILGSRGVVGLGKGRIGDLVSANWGRGSFEHTGFRALAMKGQLGVDYAAELSKRSINKGELTAMHKMELTALGEDSFLSKITRESVEDITAIDPDDLIGKRGKYVGLGRKFESLGMSNVLYVPGTEEAPYTMGKVVAGSKEISRPVESELRHFRNLLVGGKASEDELEMAAKSVRNAVIQATEEQASARGKIAGSRIVTNIRRGSGDAFGMAQTDIERMYRDLMERTTDTNQLAELTRQKTALLDEGGTVAASAWRHPTTGPESVQFTNIKLDKSLKEGMVAVPYQEGKLTIKGPEGVTTRTIDISPMTGMKADFDRDQLVISAISNRDTQQRAARQINNQIRSGYAGFLFNHYGMKDFFEGQISKGDVLRMDSAKAMAGGYQKLTTAKSTTGQVNLALQQLKLGVAYGKSDKYRPLAELFWHLEEAAIGGKHGVIGEDLYQAIAEAGKGGKQGVRSMEAVLTSVFGGSQLSLSGDVTTETGKVFKQNLTFSAKELAQYAVESGESVRGEVKTALEAARLSKGKKVPEMALGRHIERMFLRQRGSIDVAGAVMQANATDLTSVSNRAARKISSYSTKATGVLTAMKRNTKAMLIGGGVAAGLMFMAPSTSGSLRHPNKVGAAGGRHVDEEDMVGPQGLPMNPPSPGPNRSPRTYEVGGGRPTTHANIRMRMNDLDSSSRDFMASARAISAGGRVNIQAQDNRFTTDPIMLANKIHERL